MRLGRGLDNNGESTGVSDTDFVVESSTTLKAGFWTMEALGGNVLITGDDVKYTFPAG